MFNYVGIVYACIIDQLIFDSSLNWLEWIGVVLILATTITLTIHLIFSKKDDKSKLVPDKDLYENKR